mgnify:CR=1 FL=1
MTTSANELYGSPEPKISVILPVLNESKYLEEAVKAVLDQDFGGEIEIILAIGPSNDGTEVIAQSLAKADSRVVVVSNPSGRTASGLNLAVAASRYSIIVRVDGHSKIPKNYLSLAFEVLKETGAVNVGGIMAAEGHTVFERGVARAMRSPLGVGASRFHTGGGAASVDTVYLGAFRKQALVAVGGFDERFTRAQDWELNFRLRAAGGTIFFDPRLVVTYRPRSTVKALAKQYFEYGRWRRVVSRRHSGTINYRYLAPPFALLGFSASLVLGVLLSSIFFIPALVYLLFVVLASLKISTSIGEYLLLLLVIPTMHFAWGAGFISSPKTLVPASQ